jgi:hypothetical protein
MEQAKSLIHDAVNGTDQPFEILNCKNQYGKNMSTRHNLNSASYSCRRLAHL